MKKLLYLLPLFILLSAQDAGANPPQNAIRIETYIEAEGIPWGWYPEFFQFTDFSEATQACLATGAPEASTAYSGGYGYRWYTDGFDCYFRFYGNQISIRVRQTISNQNLYVEIDNTDYLITDTNGYSVWSTVLDTLDIHDARLYSTSANGVTPFIDFIHIQVDPDLLPAPYPTPTEITFPPTPTEITFPPTPTEIAMIDDGATVYATVQADGYDQTVALRYQVDAGQIAIALLLMAIFCVLLVMLISQLRKKAPEP